jgi:hypothetical protein
MLIVLTILLTNSERTNKLFQNDLLTKNVIRSLNKSKNSIAINNHGNERNAGFSRQQISQAVAKRFRSNFY